MLIMKTKYSDLPLSHKIVAVISIVVSLAVVVLAILQIFDIWAQAINVYVPLMGITLLCQTYIQWSTSRKAAYFSLGCAIVIFVCAIAILFIQNL